MTSDLDRRANTTEEFVPYFQPIMDLERDSVWAYECLARRQDQQHNVYLPNTFIPELIRTNGSVCVLRQLLTRAWHTLAQRNLSFSVNLSAQELNNAEMVHVLEAFLVEQAKRSLIMIEISADDWLMLDDNAHANLSQLRALGVRLAVDQFGRNAEHERILEQDIEAVKFDGPLIQQVLVDDHCANQLERLLHQAQWRGKHAIAEHIENRLTLDTVKEIGFHLGQGFYFSLPRAELA